MRIWGVSCQFHDAAITVIEDGVTVFAAHSERYSKKKNDAFPRTIVVTMSCINPQKIKVNSNEMAAGKIFFKGLNMSFPK